MSQAVPSPLPCAGSCETPATSGQTPGPQGPAGDNGTNGTNGVNAYSTVANYFPSAQPVMPPELGPVDVIVSSTAWMGVGQMLYVQNWGWMRVFSIINSNTVTLTNPESTGSSAYTENAAPGTSLPALSKVSPGGIQGPMGGEQSGALVASNNLSDVDDAATARSNLGLGTIATFNSPLPVANGGTGATVVADARFNLGVEIGLDVLAFNQRIQNIASLVAAGNELIYTTGVTSVALTTITPFARTLLDDVDAATARATLGITSTTLPMLLFRHQEANNIPGGAFSNGSWVTVPINTEVVDAGGHGSIAANQITLDAGTYRYEFGVVGFAVGNFQGRLFNVTDAGVITDSYGTVITAIGSPDGNAQATGVGRFTILISKVIRLEAQCTTTNAGDGFGSPGNFGGGEVYSWIMLEKES